MVYTVYMEARTIQKVTGVSSALIYTNELHKKSNAELRAWLPAKIKAAENARIDAENAENGWRALLDLLKEVEG